jgi:hypothetical protein
MTFSVLAVTLWAVGERSSVRVPDEFHRLSQQIRSVAWLLNEYLRDSEPDAPGSPAASDHSLEVKFADDQFYEPVRHVAYRGHHLLIAAVDHMLGMAACIDAEDVVFAAVSLVRPIVTAAGMSYHIFEPGVSVRERLRRGLNMELESIREQLNSFDKRSEPGAWEEIAIVRHRYLVWGRAHGYEKRRKKERNGEDRYWLADGDQANPAPSDMKLVKDVLADVGDGELGHAVYRFASSFLHGQSHAFSFFLRAAMQSDPQVPNVVPLGVSLQDLTVWVLAAGLAVYAATVRCGEYFAWDLEKWETVVHSIFANWAQALR